MLGDFDRYAVELRGLGERYARQGVAFSSWHHVVRELSQELATLLGAVYGAAPDRLVRALLAGRRFFDQLVSEIGDAYIARKVSASHEREESLAITLASIGDAVIATDTDARVQRMNGAAERLTGYSFEEAAGRMSSEVFRIENASTGEPVSDPAQRVLREGAVSRLPNPTALVARDGTRRAIADSAAPIRDRHGEICGVVLVFRDVTAERKLDLERASLLATLQDSEETLAATLGSLHEGIVIAACDGSIGYRNPAAIRMVGSAMKHLDATHGVFQVDGVTPYPLEKLPLTRSLRGEVIHEEELFVRNEGVPQGILLSVNSQPIKNRDGQSLGAVASFRDISHHRELREQQAHAAELEARSRQMQEASRMKSEFLANMSHELRTPLNAIIGFAELLYDGEVAPGTPQHRDFLGDILTSAGHLLRLINDILDLSKVEAGKLEFHPEPVRLETVAAEVTGILRATAAEKGIEVRTEVAELGEILIDSARLKQVLYNYVSNALKFTSEGGRVTVRMLESGPERFRVEVEDTGIGIASGDIARLFAQFQQLDAGAAKHHGGTGLGLALTKRLVEAQGGLVGVTSVPGKGSTFFAELPRRASASGGTSAVRAYPSARPDAPSVLIIEDSTQDQAAIAEALTQAGYAVETAPTGDRALARCRERRFDAITLDLLLPDMSGLEVLRQIRETELNQEVPVVVITVVTERGAVAGYAVHDMFAKPLDNDRLLRSLERAGLFRGRSGRVLVVDDDPSSLRLMAASLAQLGCEARCVERGSEGLAIAEREVPAAVILDLAMPEMDGFEFLERLRRQPACEGAPVLVWSVKDLTSHEYARLRHSAQGFLRKGQETRTSLVEELKRVLTPPVLGASAYRDG